jgi:hypothetical protein
VVIFTATAWLLPATLTAPEYVAAPGGVSDCGSGAASCVQARSNAVNLSARAPMNWGRWGAQADVQTASDDGPLGRKRPSGPVPDLAE